MRPTVVTAPGEPMPHQTPDQMPDRGDTPPSSSATTALPMVGVCSFVP